MHEGVGVGWVCNFKSVISRGEDGSFVITGRRPRGGHVAAGFEEKGKEACEAGVKGDGGMKVEKLEADQVDRGPRLF